MVVETCASTCWLVIFWQLKEVNFSVESIVVSYLLIRSSHLYYQTVCVKLVA